MSRNLVIAILVSIALHGGAALSGYLFKKPAAVAVALEEVPVITIDLPPPPEPEEPEIVEAAGDAPPELADIAPPMQNDVPSAVIDSAFVQQIQAPPPPSLARPSGGNIVIPTTTTRPALGAGGAGLGNIFDLKDLDKDPTPTFQPRPPYPFEMRRSGINGEVVVRFVVDSSGGVRNPQIVRSTHAAFEATVLETVVKWKFRPGEKGGAKVNTGNVVIRIPFTLQNS